MAWKIEPDTLSHWIKKNKIGFDISEIVFVNWNAGGTSSISDY
jgi:myo-inositol-1-phosphate synthase